MTNKENYEWSIAKLNEDYTKRLEECNKIIEQQRILIDQQKELIDKLLADKIVVPIEMDKQVPNYPYPYYISPITCSNATSTDTKGE